MFPGLSFSLFFSVTFRSTTARQCTTLSCEHSLNSVTYWASYYWIRKLLYFILLSSCVWIWFPRFCSFDVNIGVYLPQPAFAHGSSFVAFSRGITQDNPKILIKPNDSERDGHHNVSSFCILCSRDGLVDFRLENFNSEREREMFALASQLHRSMFCLVDLLGRARRPEEGDVCYGNHAWSTSCWCIWWFLSTWLWGSARGCVLLYTALVGLCDTYLKLEYES